MGGRASAQGARASQNLGLKAHATFSGALAWPYLYPWPQRPAGLIETAFDELARRWRPILDAFDAVGVDVCYEIHPGEDLFDGTTFERFLGLRRQSSSLQHAVRPESLRAAAARLSRLHRRLSPAHPDLSRQGCGVQSDGEARRLLAATQPWIDRAGRFRSLGDGQVDFNGIFSKLTQYDYDGWAVLEWECCIKHPEQGAAEGAPFIQSHIIRVAERAFDDFASSGTDAAANRRMLGLEMSRRLRLGMIGGGRGAFIGAVHRMAARLDDRYELVAGVFSSDPQRSRDSGADLLLDPDRCYAIGR